MIDEYSLLLYIATEKILLLDRDVYSTKMLKEEKEVWVNWQQVLYESELWEKY